MKNPTKSLASSDNLHSPIGAGYLIALSPLLMATFSLLSCLFLGSTEGGLLQCQIYVFAFAFPVLFLALDLFPIIIKKRKFEHPLTTLKTKPELFILLGFLVWNIVATILQLAIFGHSRAFTTIIQAIGVQEGLFAFVVYGVCVLMAYYVKEENIAKRILFAFLITLSILSILAIINPQGTFFFQKNCNTTWASMFVNSNHFGYVLALATLTSAMWFLFATKKWEKIVSGAMFVLFCVTDFFVDTFGSLLAIFATLILIPIVLSWFKKKFRLDYLLPLGVFVIISFLITPLGNWRYYSTYTNFFKQVAGLFGDFGVIVEAPTSELAQKAGTNRWGLWMMAFQEIAESPIIGTGNVGLRPHNEYLQYAQVWGPISAIIYISAFVVIFVKAIKHRAKLSNFSLGLLFVVCAYLISALFGNTMPHTTPFFCLFLGFLIRFMNRDIYSVADKEAPTEENLNESVE